MNKIIKKGSYDPVARSARVVRFTTRILAPSKILPVPAETHAWSSCKIANCNTFFNRVHNLK